MTDVVWEGLPVNRVGENNSAFSAHDLSSRPRTLTEGVLAKLRTDLLANRFMPGERLTLESMKSVYDVGFTPLREALMRLAADGLATREGHKGFRVFRVPPVAQ